ncbi:MAG TPA: alpha-ketoglutarate-dependent dioxygenase AlkB [Candidatus Babeliales bacterium]|nr:alpha-ketoglutarate-dependent dioxygenase AlkB [Candidatus Babeliales bacterium]
MNNLPSFSNDEVSPTSIMSDTTVLGAGDIIVHKNFMSVDESKKLFEEIMQNVDFQQWYHMPNKDEDPKPLKRIKRIMATPNSDGNLPYYRFSVNDQSGHGVIAIPAFMNDICQKINNMLGVELNHIVILLYRDGDDSIGFHKDKTLDLDENAPIVSLSLGGTRTYCLRDNNLKPTIHQEIDLENGTLLVLGPHTNENFYHAIKASDKTVMQRISITFRKAVTFKRPDGTIIGKGDKYQTLNWPEELRGNHVIGYHNFCEQK